MGVACRPDFDRSRAGRQELDRILGAQNAAHSQDRMRTGLAASQTMRNAILLQYAQIKRHPRRTTGVAQS